MAIFTVVDKASFKTWFDAGDDTFIDIGFALFTAGGFDINIDQLLAVNNTTRVSSACVALNNMRFIAHSGLTTTHAGCQSQACRLKEQYP